MLGVVTLAETVLAKNLAAEYHDPDQKTGINVDGGGVPGAADSKFNEEHQPQRQCCIDAGGHERPAAGL